MKPLLLSGLLVTATGCGFYTYENECSPKPEQGHEVDGDLVAIQSLERARSRGFDLPDDMKTIEDTDGTKRAVMAPDQDFGPDGVTVKLGNVVFSFDRPSQARPFRLEDLHARACETYGPQACTEPHGSVDVTDVGPDSIDLVVRIDDGPIEEGPVVRGSARLLFKRWQHEVCVSERKGSDSAFAIKY